jgi:phosphatidylserine/phosphatidylglycerophosphate/cardiolipin synthase-like enzyme
MPGGLSVSLFVDIEGDAPGAIAGKAHAQRCIAHLLHDNWPFGPPYPNVYYDLRSAITGPPWVSLHAKCIVIDETHSFITSANFTGRGQTRNIEVGVGIDDRDFGERLSSHFRTLVARQLVEQFSSDAMRASTRGGTHV